MFLKYPLLVCSFFLLGNAKAGVVGIRPKDTPAEVGASGQDFTFSTTGLSGSRISGIGLYRIGGTESKSLTVSLAGNNSFVTKTGSFSVAANSAGVENSITWTGGAFGLAASTNYTLTVGFADSGLAEGGFRRVGVVDPYVVESGIADYWASPNTTPTTFMAIRLYYDATSVPEPATMILTATALAGGAIGVYFKRRRKSQTEIAA